MELLSVSMNRYVGVHMSWPVWPVCFTVCLPGFTTAVWPCDNMLKHSDVHQLSHHRSRVYLFLTLWSTHTWNANAECVLQLFAPLFCCLAWKKMGFNFKKMWISSFAFKRLFSTSTHGSWWRPPAPASLISRLCCVYQGHTLARACKCLFVYVRH